MRYSPRRPSGHAFIFGPDGGVAERETLSCVHCQMTWEVEPGSGRRRGFCFRCNGPTCGKRRCVTSCVPFERALEEAERRDRLYMRARALIGK